MSEAEKNLRRVLAEVNANNYYNGGQTVVPRYPLGSEARANLIAEAAFWQGQVDREKHDQ